MSIQTAAAALTQALDEDYNDDVAGWWLGRENWTFHRWSFTVYVRPVRRGEFTRLMRQMTKSRKPELAVAGVYSLTMRDGSPIVVTGYSGYQPQLCGVLPPEWQIGDPIPWQRDPPRVRHPVKPDPTSARAQVLAPPLLVAQPVPAAALSDLEAPPRKATLSLGKNSPLAATLLENRKRQWG